MDLWLEPRLVAGVDLSYVEYIHTKILITLQPTVYNGRNALAGHYVTRGSQPLNHATQSTGLHLHYPLIIIILSMNPSILI